MYTVTVSVCYEGESVYDILYVWDNILGCFIRERVIRDMSRFDGLCNEI